MILSYNDKEEHYQQLIFNKYNIDNNMKNKVESNKNSQTKISLEITGINKKYQITQENIELLGNHANKNTVNNLSEDLIKEIKLVIKKFKNINLKREEKEQDEDLFKHKLKEGYNYPKYPNNKEGKNMLLYARNYLIAKKYKNKENVYPKYIINSTGNIDNLKRYFRNIANNYKIDDNDNLLFKFYHKDNKNQNTNNKKNRKKQENYK